MEIYTWAEHLYDFFIFTVIVPILLGLRKRKLLTTREKWVIGFLSVLLAHEVLSIVCIEFRIRNHFLYYLQTVAVASCVAGFYDGAVGPKWLLWRVALVITLGVVAEVVMIVGFNHINSVTLTLSRLMAAVCAVVSLKQVFAADRPLSQKPNTRIYFHLGFFLFGAFTAINTYFKSYFIENSLDLYYLFNTLSAMVSAVSFALFSVGFWRIGLITQTADR